MTARWSLVSTMLGLPETVLPCIAHHLNSDAERLYIYLDAPSPQIEAALAEHPRCVVTVCDAAYWAEIQGGRPDGLVRRQKINIAHARMQSISEWLVHIDSDEFLVSADPAKPFSLNDKLAAVPASHDWVRIQPMERVLPQSQEPSTIFDGVFRKQTEDMSLLVDAYGEGAAYLNRGLSGHFRGKVGFRRNTRLTVRLHDVIKPLAKGVKPPGVVPIRDLPPFTALEDLDLLHFDGWTPLHWAAKLVRLSEQGKFEGYHRGRPICVRFMSEHPAAEDRLGLFEKVQRMDANGVRLLSAAGLLRQAPFDPIELTRKTFPGVEMDFSISAFDARLRQNAEDFYRRNRL